MDVWMYESHAGFLTYTQISMCPFFQHVFLAFLFDIFFNMFILFLIFVAILCVNSMRVVILRRIGCVRWGA